MATQKGKVTKLSRRDFLKSAAAASTGLALAQTALPRVIAAQGDPVEIEYWDMVWGPPEFIETAQRLVDEFNQSQSEINVTYQSTAWNNWYQTFLTAIGSGTAPDVSTGAGYQAVQFFDFGAIRPIDDLLAEMEADGELDDFFPGLVDRLVYQDQHVALPWGIDIRLLWYRQDMFDAAGVEVPTTWDEYKAAAPALTADEHYALVGSNDTGGSHYLYSLMFNNGGGIFAEDGSLDFMYDRNVEALEYLGDLVANGWVHPGSAGFQGADADRAFGQGTAATKIDGPGFPKSLPEVEEQIGLAPPLVGPHGDQGTIFWVNNIMMYTQSENPEAAKTFLKWYSANQGPLWTEGHTGQLPTRQSIAADPYFQDDPITSRILDEWVPIATTTAARSSLFFPALNEVEGEGVFMTLVQDILQGMDVTEAMQKANDRLITILE